MNRSRLLQLMFVSFLSATPATGVWAQGGIENVPYKETFSSEEAFGKFTVIDSNHDYSTWHYDADDECARYKYSSTNDADDWLLTPPIHLEKGKSYKLSFDAKRAYSKGELLAVAYGQGSDPTAYTVLEPRIEPTSDWTPTTVEVTPTDNGDYRFGFHAISPKNLFYLRLDNISVVEAASSSTPGQVTDLTITAGAKGAVKATVSFKLPTLTKDGQPLDNISAVRILRNDEEILSKANPAVGGSFSQTFEGGLHGMNTFRVIVANAAGDGEAVKDSVWLGEDYPMPPTDIKVTDNGSNLSIAWTAPGEVGAHGGYVDPASLKYNVYDYTETKKTANPTKRNSFLDDDADVNSYNNPLFYYVSTVTPIGESKWGKSEQIYVGKPITLPIYDNFPNGFPTGDINWWFPKEGWVFTSTKSADNAGGSMMQNVAGKAVIATSKITLKDDPNPYLRFSYYAMPGTPNKLRVVASKTQKDDHELATIDYSTLNGEEGWRNVSLPLSSLGGDSYIVVRFEGDVADAAAPIYVDEVRFFNAVEEDVAVGIAVNKVGRVGTDATVKVTVTNKGLQVAKDYKVMLYANGKLVDTRTGNPIGVDQQAAFAFDNELNAASADTISYYAEVDYPGDEDFSDNKTEVVKTITVKNLDFERASSLKGTYKDGKVNLKWVLPEQQETVTESFENFRPWTTDYLGRWKLVDGDRANTYAFGSIKFKNQGEPMAYIVFNPEAAGLDVVKEDPEIAPHSGKQFMGSFAAIQELAQKVVNNDYLISPKLNGNAQTVTFWAKSLFEKNDTASLKESFEVLASMASAEIGDMQPTTVRDNAVPADVWKQYSVNLPAGTHYFAIHCTSDNKFLFMVDDVTFSPAPLTVKGYNIYRNGIRIGNVTSKDTMTFTDSDAGDGDEYRVSVVYEEGESELSDAFTIATGISTVGYEHRKDDTRYNIAGQRVSDDYKGIVIRNGKKVLVK